MDKTIKYKKHFRIITYWGPTIWRYRTRLFTIKEPIWWNPYWNYYNQEEQP